MKNPEYGPKPDDEGEDVNRRSGRANPVNQARIGVRDLLARKVGVMNLAELVSFHASNIVHSGVKVHG